MSFIRNNKIITIILVIFSIYVYYNFTRPIEVNELVDRSSMSYVNDLYASKERIYNEHLNTKEKQMYRLILNNSKNYNASININPNDFDCNSNDECSTLIAPAFEALSADHPELMNQSGYKWSYKENELKIKLNLKFAVKTPLVEQIAILKIQRMISDIKIATKDMTDLEKIYYVYDWIGKSSYDHGFTYASKNQSIYNVFIKEQAVCTAFAKSSQVIFQNIGIESFIVTGDSTGPHMWNIIKYNDKYYYYDSTYAAGTKNKKSEHYYKGLVQEEMNFYTMNYPEWYPKIEQTNVFR